jgi:very-short-patch-repair endonuclease
MGSAMAAAGKLAAKQYGVIHRRQWHEVGGTREAWRWALGAGELTPVGTHVVRLPGSTVSHEQRLMAAVLDAGRDAVVSFRAACWLHDYDGVKQGPIEITVPPGRRVVRDNVIVHVSDLPESDVVHRRGFPVTSPLRTAIDMAQFQDRRVLEHVVDSVLRTPGVEELDLRRRLAEIRGQGRGGVVLLDKVLDGLPAGGLHTVLERAFFRIVRGLHLAEPRTQAVFHVGGRCRRVDFLWDDLVVEVSGHRTHSSRNQRREDAERQRALVTGGLRVVEFTSDEVFATPDKVGIELTDLLSSVPGRGSVVVPP